MNGEGQRPPAPPDTAQASTDAPEPGTARYPEPGVNGNGNVQLGPAQEGQGGGGRRSRGTRRGGRGRRGKGGQGQGQVAPPLDAQGRIVDVENDGSQEAPVEEGLAEGAPSQPAEPQPAGDAAAPTAGGIPTPQPPDPAPPQQPHRQ